MILCVKGFPEKHKILNITRVQHSQVMIFINLDRQLLGLYFPENNVSAFASSVLNSLVTQITDFRGMLSCRGKKNFFLNFSLNSNQATNLGSETM